jgi:hypothetical protein
MSLRSNGQRLKKNIVKKMTNIRKRQKSQDSRIKTKTFIASSERA